MVRNFLTGVGLFAVMAAGVGAATAADLAVKAPQVYTKAPVAVPAYVGEWSGLYLGVNGGFGWAKSNGDADIGDSGKMKGGLYGGQVGYNWQFGSAVAGVEVDYDGASISRNDTRLGVDAKIDQLGTARARLGYVALPNLLVYGTGGGAWGHAKATDLGGNNYGLSQTGWVVGAGVEYKVWGNITARAEYLHYGFGSKTVDDFYTVKNSVDAVRAGINYKF